MDIRYSANQRDVKRYTTQELRVLTARPQYEPRFALLEWFYEATGQNDRA